MSLSALLEQAILDEMLDLKLESEVEFMLEMNPELIDLLSEGVLLEDMVGQLNELKVPSPKEVKARAKAKSAAKSKKNLRKGNPGNDPWSDYGARGVPGASGTGGTTMHDVLGKGGRSKTGEWSCKCKNYECDCKSSDGSTKSFRINKGRHLAYNRRYKAHAHPRKDHPRSV